MSHAAPRVDQTRYIIERDSHGVAIRRYRQGRLLGKGGFAKCYIVTDCTTNEEFAAKIIDKQSLTKPKTQQKLVSEIKIHSMMAHPNLVQYKHCFEDDKFVYILLELCSEQTLMEHSKQKWRFSEEETSFFISQCIKGLKYMHANAVIHRDLKLSNLLLDDEMCVKIADFGLATQLDYDGERKRTVCGTPNYIAPEILEASHKGHSFEVDIWSLGVIMYTLLVGKPPFEMSDMKSTYKRIRQVSYSFPVDLQVSEEARNLVRRILQADPEKRPNLSGILADPFFQRHPPCPYAPLSMFRPGTSRYYQQEKRLLEHARQRERDQAQVAAAAAAYPYSAAAGRSPLGRLDSNMAGVAQCGGAGGGYRSGSVGGYGQGAYGSAVSARSAAEWSPGYRTASAGPTSASPRAAYRADIGGLAPPLLQGGGGGGGSGGHPVATPSPAGFHHRHPASTMRSGSSPYSTSPPRLSSMHPVNPASLPAPGSAAAAAAAIGGGVPSSAVGVASPETPEYPTPHNYHSTGRSPSQQSRSPYRSSSLRRTPSGHVAHRQIAPPALATPQPQAAAVPAAVAGTTSPQADIHHHPALLQPPSAVPHVALPAHEWEPRAAVPASLPTRSSSCSPREVDPVPAARPTPAAPAADEEDSEDKANLTTMHEVLEKTINRGPVAAPIDTAEPAPAPEDDAAQQTSITCYSDFTSKYGLAYMLNNDNVGAHFNDSTKIVWNLSTNQVQYVARSRASDPKDPTPVPEEKFYCTPEDYPEFLRKKITLITYFRTYLMRGRNTDTVDHPEVVACGKGKLQVESSDTDFVYVKRWLKTRYAIIFRLSNKSVQVSFFDGTEILLFSEARQVTYTDEAGNRSTFSLSSMLVHPKPEIAQRLKYTKEIICRLINKA